MPQVSNFPPDLPAELKKLGVPIPDNVIDLQIIVNRDSIMCFQYTVPIEEGDLLKIAEALHRLYGYRQQMGNS